MMLVTTCIMAQSNSKKFENSYLSMNIPDGWEIQTPEVPGLGMELLVFTNSGALHNMGMIIGFEQQIDPKAALQAQIDAKNNLFFANADFGEIHTSTFMGKKAETVDFSTVFMNTQLKGAAYAFKSGDCSIIAVGGYKPGVKSNLPQIWRSIQWKEHKKKVYASLQEELTTFVTAFNERIQKTPIDYGDGQLTGVACDTNKKCLIYKLRIPSLSRFDFTEEQIKQMQAKMQILGVSFAKEAVNGSELIQKCVNDNYSLRYDIYDKGDNFLYNVLVTAAELK